MDTEKQIDRTVVIAVGEKAQQVVSGVVAFSQSVLGASLPLFVVTLPQAEAGDEESAGQFAVKDTRQWESLFAATCDQLADAALAEALRKQRLTLNHANDLHLWLVVDWTGSVPGAAERWTTQALEAGVVFARTAWQRVRAETLVHLVLLAEPDQQGRLNRWALDEPHQDISLVFLAGPVNQLHLRFESPRWLAQAARAMAALIWGERPSYSMLERSSQSGMAFCAIGAATWQMPHRALTAWCASAWAGWFLDRLLRQGGEVAPAPDALASSLFSLLDEQAVERTVAPALPALLWRAWRPSWALLPVMVDTVVSHVQRYEAQRRQEQETARRRWLEQLMHQWNAALADHETAQIGGAQRWPMLASWRTDLAALSVRLDQLEGENEQRLARATHQLEAARTQTERLVQELRTLCDSFPVQSWPRLAAMALQPWRWPQWLWRYLVTLPKQGQLALAAMAHSSRCARSEANLHTVRQGYLLAAQSLRERQAQGDRLDALLQALEEEVTAATAAEQERIPQPWTAAHMAALRTLLLGNGEAEAWALLEHLPLLSWLGLPAPTVLTYLLGHVAHALVRLERWSALELLVLAFDPAIAPPPADPGALDQWLKGFLSEAAPLWPHAEDQPMLPSEAWLLAPSLLAGAESDPLTAPAVARILAWGGTVPERLVGESNCDVVMAVRWSIVDLNQEEKEHDIPRMVQQTAGDPGHAGGDTG